MSDQQQNMTYDTMTLFNCQKTEPKCRCVKN